MSLDNILLIPGVGGGSPFDSITGLVSAYSLAKVRSSYQGACLRVRRSSDSAEQDIGFSGGIIDTAALLSFVGASDGLVVTWYDQGLTGLNASQSVTTSQPRIVNAGSLEVNGIRPTIRFFGNRFFETAAPNIAFGSQITAYAVASLGFGNQAILAQWNAVSPRVFGLFDITTDAGVRFTLNNNAIQAQTGSRTQPIPLSSFFGVYNSVTARAWINNVQGIETVASAAVTAGGVEPITLGAERAATPTSFLTGTISEAFISTVAISDDVRVRIDSNRRAFWGIT